MMVWRKPLHEKSVHSFSLEACLPMINKNGSSFGNFWSKKSFTRLSSVANMRNSEQTWVKLLKISQKMTLMFLRKFCKDPKNLHIEYRFLWTILLEIKRLWSEISRRIAIILNYKIYWLRSHFSSPISLAHLLKPGQNHTNLWSLFTSG